jgi:hypothetical protein
MVALLLGGAAFATAFQSPTVGATRPTATAKTARATQCLYMANDDDFMRWARASRSAGAGDNVVELMRPLGLVLNEDDQGNVYVETVAPKGNAARTGKVRCVASTIYCT